MKIIVITGQGSAGKSYLARELAAFLAEKESVRLVSMDDIVKHENLSAEHWRIFEDEIIRAVHAYSNVVIDFWNHGADHILMDMPDTIKLQADLVFVQLHPVDWRVLLEHQRQRQYPRPISAEQADKIYCVWKSVRTLTPNHAERFGFRSNTAVTYRDPQSYFTDAVKLLTEGYEHGRQGANGALPDTTA